MMFHISSTASTRVDGLGIHRLRNDLPDWFRRLYKMSVGEVGVSRRLDA